MLAMVLAIPTGFGLLVWRSYRSESARRARGDQVSTPGALRWTPRDEGEERAREPR
jgi:hypothetical protein